METLHNVPFPLIETLNHGEQPFSEVPNVIGQHDAETDRVVSLQIVKAAHIGRYLRKVSVRDLIANERQDASKSDSKSRQSFLTRGLSKTALPPRRD